MLCWTTPPEFLTWSVWAGAKNVHVNLVGPRDTGVEWWTSHLHLLGLSFLIGKMFGPDHGFLNLGTKAVLGLKILCCKNLSCAFQDV